MNIEVLNGLKLFNEKATKLQNCSFTKIVFSQNTGITISGEGQGLVQFERRGPNEEAIDAFVLTVRFFIQDNEKSSFGNMAKTYAMLPVAEEKKEKFIIARTAFNDFLDRNTILKIDNQHLSFRNVFETFIYGGLSHANEEKKKLYDKWVKIPLVYQMLLNDFVFSLSNLMRVVMYVKTLNDEVIKELE